MCLNEETISPHKVTFLKLCMKCIMNKKKVFLEKLDFELRNMITLKNNSKSFVSSINRSWKLLWGLESLLVFYDYITNYQKLNSIEQHICIVSQFLWERNLSITSLGPLLRISGEWNKSGCHATFLPSTSGC